MANVILNGVKGEKKHRCLELSLFPTSFAFGFFGELRKNSSKEAKRETSRENSPPNTFISFHILLQLL